MLLGWCDETAGSTTAEDLAYDISNRPFSLTSIDQLVVAIVSMNHTRVWRVLGLECGRRDWSRLFVYAGRPHTYERSLLVQAKPFGRLKLYSSVGNIVRLIHGKLSCADPCRNGLSLGYRRMLVVNVDKVHKMVRTE